MALEAAFWCFGLFGSIPQRQFKYFIKFWSTFVEERECRKQKRVRLLAQRASKRLQSTKSLQSPHSPQSTMSHKASSPLHSDHLSEHKLPGDGGLNSNGADSGNGAVDDGVSASTPPDDGPAAEPGSGGAAPGDVGDSKEHDQPEAADDDDLYAEDHFVYDDDHDDRPRGQVLLERVRGDVESVDLLQEDAALRIAIPCDVEQLVIRGCKNRSGELANWVSSVLCHVDTDCPVDWLGLEGVVSLGCP